MWHLYTYVAIAVGLVAVGFILLIPLPVNVTSRSGNVPPVGTRISLDGRPLGRVIATDGTRLAVQPFHPLWRWLVRLYWRLRSPY